MARPAAGGDGSLSWRAQARHEPCYDGDIATDGGVDTALQYGEVLLRCCGDLAASLGDADHTATPALRNAVSTRSVSRWLSTWWW